ncbi:hypothetical protein [Nitratireductor indicus]|uniref:hypothetical protein n=1 Tax=Nitratireductor indicus TaxID=721133 RepID=UPI00287607C4|nr:hypothetical protein [Nitratireductor indicus]MDS1136237.1 hypothetical protein [Nitratireductor indicus]
MNSVWIRWPISVVFGILSGRLGFGIVGPFVLPLMGEDPQWAADMPGGYQGMLVLAVIVQLLLAIVIAVFLARIENIKRLIGWGCIVLGTILLLNVLSTALFSGLSLQDLVEADTRAKNDAATAFWFWVIAMAMPFVGSGLILYVVGILFLRSGRKAQP